MTSQSNFVNILLLNANNLQLISGVLRTSVSITIVSPSNTTPSQESSVAYGNNPDYNQKFNFQLATGININDCFLKAQLIQHSLFSKTVIGERTVALNQWSLDNNETLGLTFALAKAPRGWITVHIAYNAELTELRPAATAALFTTQKQEYPNPTPIRVISGSVPQWLNGMMLSQVGGEWEFGKEELIHYFDSPSMVNKFQIQNQQVSYQSKYLTSSYYVDSNRMNKLTYVNFAQRPSNDSKLVTTYNHPDIEQVVLKDYPSHDMAVDIKPDQVHIRSLLQEDEKFQNEKVDIVSFLHEGKQYKTLNVAVKSARNLPNMDSGILGDVSDPYVIVTVPSLEEDNQYRTKTINNNLNPVWNETMTVKIGEPTETILKFSVYDKDLINDDYIGMVHVDLSKLTMSNNEPLVLADLPLASGTSTNRGTLTIELTPVDFDLQQHKDVKLDFDKAGGFLFGYSKNANVNFDVLGPSGPSQKVIAITDVPYAAEFDVNTLATIQEPFQWSDNVSSITDILSPAHPQYNPQTGMSYNVITTVSGLPLMRYKFVKYNGPTRTVFGSLAAEEKPRYFHSFSLTSNYMVLIYQPYVVNMLSFMLNQPVICSYEYSGDKQNKFVVIDVNTGKVYAEFLSDAFAYYHTANAYEYTENNQKYIALDVVAYDNENEWNIFAAQYTQFYKTHNHVYEDSVNSAKLKRFTLPLPANTSKTPITLTKDQQKTMTDAKFEMPTINPSRRTQNYTYLYGAGINSNTSSFLDNLVKVDVTTAQVVGKWTQPNLYPGEALFVSNPNPTSEDDGVLLSIVRDVTTPDSKSFLLILDAKTLTEVARVEAPCRIPAGIHGIFMSSQ